MNIKINTICFIILLFLLLGVVSATENDNETLQQTIEQPEDDICQVNPEDQNEVELNNDNLNAATKTTKSTVNIKAPDVKMYYKDGSKFTVTVKDENKKVIKNAKVKISIDGKSYTKTTDSKGKASINLNFNSGTYNVVTTFDETPNYKKASVKSTIIIKSTIKCSDYSKFYKNNGKYSATFYDKKGKLLKEIAIKFKLNSKSYNVKTNKKGIAKLSFDLKPGTYSISSINSATSETVKKTITVKSLIETKDLVMNESDGSKFKVKVLNSYGKVSPNKKVTLKVNGKTYTPKSNSNGIATQAIDLPVGKYTITTEYEGLKNINKITINKAIQEEPLKKTQYVHSIIIPNYVNVTIPYAFHNSAYTLKTGYNGTVKMPKIEVFVVSVGSKTYQFATGKTNIGNIVTMEYLNYYIPLKGIGTMASYTKEEFKEPGIIISRTPNSTEIDFIGVTSDNNELFGFYADKGSDNSEIFTYLKNDEVVAKVSVQTQYYDETGVKYNLAKLYNRVNTDFNYYEITNHVEDPIVFTNTGLPVTYSYYTNFIAGYQTREDIVTKFSINGREEVEKIEQISYGHGEKYRRTLGFEVLQSYAIINEKINQKIVDKWISKSSQYLNKYGIMNVYAMFLASLNTAWMADEFANAYSKEYDVNWKRSQTATIMGGMNLDKTYLHILNADMGMEVTGDNETNIALFRLINSIGLPELEKIALQPISKRFGDNATNALEDLFKNHTSSSIIFSDDLALIQMENSNTSIIINQSSGVANVIMKEDDFYYKGASVNTANDCCSCNQVGNDVLLSLCDDAFRLFLTNPLTYPHLKDLGYEIGLLAHKTIPYLLGITGMAVRGLSGFTYGIFGFVLKLQDVGTTYRSQQDQSKWYSLMDTYTFTRPGFFQQKKVYNIPNKNGGYDYVEAPIKSDFSLDRENTLYISNGNVKKLTKEETYNYYSDDYYSLYTVPPKYWNKN